MSGASPRGRPAAARWQKDKITQYKQDKTTKKKTLGERRPVLRADR